MQSPRSKNAASAKTRHRWTQFSVRSLLLFITVIGVWLAIETNRANRQRRAVAAITSLGGTVGYDYAPLDPTADAGLYSGQRSDSPPPQHLVRLLGEHYFVEVVAAHFQACPNLKDDDLDSLAGLSEIQTVELQGTQISDSGLEKLRHLRPLKNLDLRDTHVSGRGLSHISGATGLIYLGLAGRQVDDGGLEHVGKFTTLEGLDIVNASITDKGLSSLATLKDLKILAIRESHEFTDAGLIHLKDLSRLERLQLGGTEITDDGLAHLSGLTKLWTLALNDTNVSDAGLIHLECLPNLKSLYLEGTRVTTSGAARWVQLALLAC